MSIVDDLFGGLGFGGNETDPIVSNLPQINTAFVNKYQTLQPVLPRLSPQIRNSLVNFDLKRVAKGQTPLGMEQTVKAIQAASTGQAVTQPPRPKTANLWGNALRNLRDITASIPRLPLALAREVSDLQDLPEAVSTSLSTGNPLKAISGLAQAPGIRMLPGAYVVGNLAEGDVAELAQNPVMTALDVLPFAQKAAAQLPVNKALAAQKATLEGAGKFAPEIRPIRGALTRRLDEAGEIIPNRVGQATAALARTRPGQALSDSFSQQARASARIAGQGEVEFKNLISPEGLPNENPVVFATRQAQQLNQSYNITPERAAAINDAIQTDRSLINTLPDNEAGYAREYIDLLKRFEDHDLRNNILTQYGGEIYDNATGRRLHGIQSRYNTRHAKIQSTVIPKLEAIWQSGRDPRVANLLEAIYADDFRTANQIYNGMVRGKTRLDKPQGVARGTSVAQKSMAPADITLGQITDIRNDLRAVAAAKTTLERVQAASVPARFQYNVAKKAAAIAGEKLALSTADEAAEVASRILERDFDGLPIDIRDFRGTVDDIRRTWQKMRDEDGLDPVFVHRVTASRAQAAQHMGVLNRIPSLSQAQARAADISPSVKDISVSLSHQGMELLRRDVMETSIGAMVNRFGVDQAELIQRYTPAARVAQQMKPTVSFEEHLNRLIRQDYRKFDPGAFVKSGALNQFNPEQTFLPRTVIDNIERSMNPATYRLTSVLDPITGAFRTSLLPLSPRWHLYNILGGGIMLGARTGPKAFTYANEARQLLSALKSGDLKTVQKRLPRDMVLGLGGTVREAAELNLAAGKTLGRLWNEVRQSRPALGEAGDKFGRGFKRVTDKSFEVNQWFDDGYRVMGYLYGYDKALTKGMSKAAAEKTGIELARKMIQQWDEYTPIERQVLRHIFPFYGFTQHLIRYAMKYPFDHPVRASIMGGIARNEIEDLGTGLPTSFLNAFFIGDQDENGNQRAISLQGLNPFSDVANMMTLAGFASATNPLIGTALEQMGIEGGKLELYPNLRYDSTTGQMTAVQENPLVNFAHNVIPQTQVLTSLLGVSSEFKELLRTDPAAAMRSLRSQAGLPIITRVYDVPSEYFKAETRRGDAERDAKNDALRSGNWSYANRFPGLAGLQKQIATLQAGGQLADFTPTYSIPNRENALGF